VGGVVICVDDEAMILTSLREQLRALSDLGLTVEFSTDGRDALDLLDELIEDGEEVPLFISDHIMPGLKGDEVLKAVAARSPKTRCVLLTGQADLEAVQRAVNEANLYRYMSKPWEQADLLMTARSAIDSYRTDVALEQHRRELEETNAVFKRFVPEPFIQRITSDGITSIELGRADQVELTILFSDIRGFTTLAETMSPPALLEMLNSYFEALSAPIHAVGGFIDKFIGDAIMAIFEGEGHAQRALEAALGMAEALKRWNEGRAQPLSFGVGMHSGEVVMGTVGTSTRMDSTVLGDSVNLAARLEGLTKDQEPPLIASEQTVTLASLSAEGASSWRVEEVGQTQVKGRAEPVRYFRVCAP
jgi:class 3 adenylate cyclase